MWTYVEDGRFGLLCSAVGWGILGVIYTVNAPFMYGLYGIELSNINALSMVRGVYGGCFLGIASLWTLGLLKARFREAALLTMFVCMLGFTIGRTASLVVDGTPTWHMYFLFGLEASGVPVSGYALFFSPKSPLKGPS